MFSAKRTNCHFLRCAKSNQKARARTCKKLPVASFCASETAETGRIANGREQGDHVSRRQESYKVFCPTFCALQKVGQSRRRSREAAKGFNWVSVKLSFEWADSRFAESQISLQGSTDCHFLRRAKSNQKARGTPSCDLDSKLCRK